MDLHHTGSEPHLLREVVRTYQVLMASFVRRVGIPASRFTLMRLLANAETPVGVMDLSRMLGVNAAAVTRQMHEMQNEGLVLRRADAKDGRRCQFRLSAKGRRLFAQIHERTHELEGSLASVLGQEEMASAAGVLVRLREYMESAQQ